MKRERLAAQLRVTNTGDRNKPVGCDLNRPDHDGRCLSDLPRGGIVPHGRGGINLSERGRLAFDLPEMFLHEDVTAAEGSVTKIEYADGTKRPSMLAGIIGGVGMDSVGARMIGDLASESSSHSEAVFAFANAGMKLVQSIEITIEYSGKSSEERYSKPYRLGGDRRIHGGQRIRPNRKWAE